MPESGTAILLRPAGLLWGVVMSVRNLLYDHHIFASWKSPLPVVSVGNITAGGTGKTPIVSWIAQFYHASGYRTAIISRGYGRSTKGVQLVSDGQNILLGSREAGDETAMLAARNPTSIVIVAELRRAGVEFLMQRFADRLPEVIILDDAFQHRKIGRDLDIVVINAGEPFSGAAMLPEGRLREPLKGVRRADLFILGKITDEQAAEAIAAKLAETGKPVIKSRIVPEMLVPIADTATTETTILPMAGKTKVFAFAGIGSPSGFVQSLRQMGLEVAAERFFRDHAPYRPGTLQKIVAESRQKLLLPVTTEKDFFRLRDDPRLLEILTEIPCAWLKIEPDLYKGEDTIASCLLSLVQAGRKQGQ